MVRWFKKRERKLSKAKEVERIRREISDYYQAWNCLGADLRDRIAKYFSPDGSDPMIQFVIRHRCFAVIRDLGFVRGQKPLRGSWVGVFVDEEFWNQGGGKPVPRPYGGNR